MDLLDEVTKDENFERNVKFFKRLLVVAICITILGLLSMWWYTSYVNRSNRDKVEMSDMMFKAMMSPDLSAKKTILNSIIAQDKNLPVKDLAEIYLAVTEIKSENFKEAKALLQKIADNNSYQHLTTHYAAYLLITLGVDHDGLLSESEMTKYFDMFNDKKAALRLNSMVLKGLWLYKNNQLAEAKTVLKSVLSESKSKNNFTIAQAKALLSNINLQKHN